MKHRVKVKVAAKTEQLAEFIRSHGVPVRIIRGRKTGRVVLRVASQYVSAVQSESKPVSSWIVENIPASRDSVLNFLGYR